MSLQDSAGTEPDYDRLLRANLERVFNERDPERRAAAVADLFVEEPVMYEPDAVVGGREAISAVAGKLLERFGLDFAFVPEGQAAGHYGMASLRWHAGPRNGAPLVSGIDTAEVRDGRIARLWVLLDSSSNKRGSSQSGQSRRQVPTRCCRSHVLARTSGSNESRRPVATKTGGK